MSGVTTATVIAGIAAAATVGGTIASMTAGTPKLPTPQAPAAAPQPTQVPTASAVLAGTNGAPAAGPGGSNASTLLTGGQGVDPSKLFLGKSQILGG